MARKQIMYVSSLKRKEALGWSKRTKQCLLACTNKLIVSYIGHFQSGVVSCVAWSSVQCGMSRRNRSTWTVGLLCGWANDVKEIHWSWNEHCRWHTDIPWYQCVSSCEPSGRHLTQNDYCTGCTDMAFHLEINMFHYTSTSVIVL